MPWLRWITKVPLILKGILHPDDAHRASTAASTASSAPTTAAVRPTVASTALDHLPEVVEAAGSVHLQLRHPLRRRRHQSPGPRGHRRRRVSAAHVYGLAIGGTDGVRHVLRSILAEADLIMAVDGYPTLKDLVPGALRRVG